MSRPRAPSPARGQCSPLLAVPRCPPARCRLCLPILVLGRAAKGSSESRTGGQEGTRSLCRLQQRDGNADGTLAPGEGKRKLMNGRDARLGGCRGAPAEGLHMGSCWSNPLPRPQRWVEVGSSWVVCGLGCALLSQERGGSGHLAGEGSEQRGAGQSPSGNLCRHDKGMKS